MGNIEDQIEEINGFKVLATEVEVSNAKEIRQTMDDFKSKQQDAIIILASDLGEKVSLIATVPKEQTDKIKRLEISLRIWRHWLVVKVAVVQIWLKVAVRNQRISQKHYALLKITLKTITL